MKDIHGGNIWAMARRYGFRPEELIDFSASINPLGLRENIKDAILRNLDCIIHYPDPDYQELNDVLAGSHMINPENVLVGNGSVEFIYLIPRTLKPGKVLLPVPAFSEYERAVLSCSSAPEFIYGKEDDLFSISARQIIRLVQDVDMVFLSNPNNPTGLVFEKDTLLEIIEACDKRGVWVIIDEAFIEFLNDCDELTLIHEAVRKKRVMVLRSFTKSYAIPGLRLGYLIGHKETIRILKDAREPWGVNSLASAAGCEAARDSMYMKSVRGVIEVERNFLFSELGSMKSLKLFPARANFILGALYNANMDAETLSEKLAMRGILIRDLTDARGLDSRFFRFAVKRRNENEMFIAALGDILLSESHG